MTDAIHSHKPGDKVTVTYLRDGKEQKATAELDRWKGIDIAGVATSPSWNAEAWNNTNRDHVYHDLLNNRWNAEKRDSAYTRLQGGRGSVGTFQTFGQTGTRPRLGLSVQDTDDGKGVKVLNTDEDGNAAKAGIKEDDIILQIDDKAVNSADELAAQTKLKKDQSSMKFQVQRDGKTQVIEVRIPKKLKTVNL